MPTLKEKLSELHKHWSDYRNVRPDFKTFRTETRYLRQGSGTNHSLSITTEFSFWGGGRVTFQEVPASRPTNKIIFIF